MMKIAFFALWRRFCALKPCYLNINVMMGYRLNTFSNLCDHTLTADHAHPSYTHKNTKIRGFYFI